MQNGKSGNLIKFSLRFRMVGKNSNVVRGTSTSGQSRIMRDRLVLAVSYPLDLTIYGIEIQPFCYIINSQIMENETCLLT